MEAVAISLLGFFSGPFFATVRIQCPHDGSSELTALQGISVASKIFPANIRSSGIGTCL